MKLVERVKALWNLFTKGTMTKADKVILLLAVVYCLSPIDVIPVFVRADASVPGL